MLYQKVDVCLVSSCQVAGNATGLSDVTAERFTANFILTFRVGNIHAINEKKGKQQQKENFPRTIGMQQQNTASVKNLAHIAYLAHLKAKR